jgi:hypothetical protein
MAKDPRSHMFPKPDRPLGAVGDDINGLVAYLTMIVPLSLIVLAVVALSRPL